MEQVDRIPENENIEWLEGLKGLGMLLLLLEMVEWLNGCINRAISFAVLALANGLKMFK